MSAIAPPRSTRRVPNQGAPPPTPPRNPNNTGGNPGGGDGPRRKLPMAVVITLAAMVLIVGIIIFISLNGGSDHKSGPQAPKTIAPSQVPGANQASGTAVQRHAVSRWLKAHKWRAGQYSFRIVKPVSLQRGANAVSAKPVLTKGQLKAFINGGGVRSSNYRAYAKAHLSAAQYRQVLSTNGFVRVQLLKRATYVAGTYLAGNRIYFSSSARGVNTGDVIWVFAPVGKVLRTAPNGVTTNLVDAKVAPAGNTRAGCGNGNEIPVPASTVPPAPPVSVPPTPRTHITTPPPPRTPPHGPPPPHRPPGPKPALGVYNGNADHGHYQQPNRAAGQRAESSTQTAPSHARGGPVVDHRGDSQHAGTRLPASRPQGTVTLGGTSGTPAPSGNPGGQGSDGASGSNPTPPAATPDPRGANPPAPPHPTGCVMPDGFSPCP